MMTNLPCNVMQDLLPLYQDEELSAETVRLVEEHLQECAKCRSAWENTKGTSGPLDLRGLSESLPAADTFKSLMGRLRRLAASGLGVILILLLLVGSAAFFLGRDSRPGMAAVKMRSEPELQAYIYDKIPGLKRAESLGRVEYPDLQFTFPGLEEADLRIEKVWYTREVVYLVYSLGGGVIPRDIGANMQHDRIPLTSNYVSGGALYQGRFYGYFPLWNQKESVAPAVEKAEMEFSLDIVLTVHDRQFASEEGLISILYDPAWDEPLFLELNGALPLMEGELIFHAVEITPAHTYLYLDYNHPLGNTLDVLTGWLCTDSGEKHRFFAHTEPGAPHSTLRIALDALDTVPGSLRLEIDRVVLVSAEQVEFTIDALEYRSDVSKTESPKLHLRELHGTEIILERLHSDERGISFGLLYKWPRKLREPYTVMIAGGFPDSTGGYYSFGGLTPDVYIQAPDFEEDPYRRISNIVTAVNEKGDPAAYGSTGAGPGERMMMFLQNSFVRDSETIYVTVKNLTYLLAGRWEADVPVIRE